MSASPSTAPRVSLGMPVYNEETHLEAALAALSAQTLGDFEVTIWDNASTDRTPEIARDIAARDQRFRVHRSEQNIGSIANLNRTFEGARGEFFAWASGHDLRAPTFLARCVETLEASPKAVLAYPLARWIEPDGSPGALIGGHIDTRGMDRVSGAHVVMWGLGYAHPVYGVFRTATLASTGLMRKLVAPDVLLLLELSLLGEIAEVPEPLLFMQRLADYGSWQHYLAKSFGVGSRGASGRALFARWVWEHLRLVGRRAPGPLSRLALWSSVLFAMPLKYGFVLRGLEAETRRARNAAAARPSRVGVGG